MIQYFEEMTLSNPVTTLNANSISAFLNDFESDELFLTSIDQIDDVEFITNTLSNKAFAHRLTAKDDTIEVFIKLISYSYITSSESRYDDREFKGLLIDSDAARKSIEKMGQFKALQRIDDVKLNKSNRHIFKFEIENISFVESINLETSLETITFHIVETNISFLLFLADLDRLSVYFNNLTNELMQDRSAAINILQIDMKNDCSQTQIDMKNDRYSMIRRYEHAFLL